MEGQSPDLVGLNATIKKLWFLVYVVVTATITGAVFWAVGQTGLWTSVIALFVVSYMVLWGLITAEE